MHSPRFDSYIARTVCPLRHTVTIYHILSGGCELIMPNIHITQTQTYTVAEDFKGINERLQIPIDYKWGVTGFFYTFKKCPPL